MRRRLGVWAMVAGSLLAGMMAGGCGSGEVVVLGNLLGDWRNGESRTLTVSRPSAQAARAAESIVITYPSETEGASYLLSGSVTQSGSRYSGTFQVTSGPSARDLGPIAVGTAVVVTLTRTGDELNSSISRAGMTIEDDWTRVIE